ncbi:MAG: UvrD-helicase domain-containing protein [Gammaproteobacteria bacterium]|nr:UvrD-helicase domain-containing protein [Gammaproteobacteria bacterium]
MAEIAISDAAQRRRALDIDHSFIVQAPAGSGKTELLTQRYLCLLARVSHPEEICAITFTRKAAAEMRNRVLGALDRADGPEPVAAHERLTWHLACAARNRDREQDWQLAHNPNRLRIQTFDSLAHSLARQLPLLSTFGAPPVTTDRPEIHYRSAARATLRQLDDEVIGLHIARLLQHLDNRLAQLEDLLASMLGRRDQWLGHALSPSGSEELETALRDAVEERLAVLLDMTDKGWLQALCEIAAWSAGNRAEPGASPWHERTALPLPAWDELPAWQALAELLLTKDGKRRKSWDAKLGFPAPSKERDSDRKAALQQAKDDAAALVAGMDDATCAAWHALRILPGNTLAGDQHDVLVSLLQVLVHASAELTLVFRETGEVDFAETQMCAQRAIGSPDAPTDLALALDYRLQHLLVDEFQDTSTSQYRLLSTLTAAWQPGDGRTLFAVGDPMQSIYRFREAEVGLYLAAREHGIGQLALEPLTLEVNFRSTSGVIDWINRCFGRVFPAKVDIARGAVPYAESSPFDTTTDAKAVQVHPLLGRDDHAEARQVVTLVQDALEREPQGSVAILARARSHLHAIAAALANAGLRYQAVDVVPLAEQAVVRDLYHLTRALLHPADRLAWLVVLRAPWLGLVLEDLLLIAEGSDACIPTRLRDPAVRATLSEDGRCRVERLLAVVDPQLPARGRRPLRQWIEGIWLRLGGLAAAGIESLADANAFLALLDRYGEADGLADFSQLDSAIEGLYAAPDSRADGRIQLMTMHKAKGLEFDTVILPGLGRQPPAPKAELLYWLERGNRQGDIALLMAPIRAAEQSSEPISNFLRELDRDKSRLEITRLLYVAATRAKRRLHLLGHVMPDRDGNPGTPTSDSLLEKLWPCVSRSFENPTLCEAIAVPASNAEAPERLPADWQLLPLPSTDKTALDQGTTPASPPIEFDWAGDSARHVGTLVHRHLERIAEQGVAQWDAQRIDGLRPNFESALRHLGVPGSELERAVDKTCRALRQTLDDETGRWILGPHAQSSSEWALTLHGDEAQHFVIDRTFVDEQGIRWIVDYKTGDHQDDDREEFLDREQARYREQLETYARIVRLLEPRPIRLALYFPLFPDWRVWDYQG